MATLASQQIVQTGLNPAQQAAAAGGDKFRPGANTFLRVVNGSGASITATVDSVAASSYGTDVDLVVAVPAGGERWIGPLPEQRFGNPSDSGMGNVSYSAVTSVTVGAYFI
ncbi:MAG: hypothetical protein LC798_16800 [Chloroflexi bacterium]|nr:hypothetical protein [Chloroflexota bacterium]